MASHSPPTAIPTANPINIIQALKKDNKCQATPWTHEETLNLIRAYQEKWYSLKRGQLKASQWEEVAVTVAARCSLDEPSKSATQCRHKIEKLRKRYRAEKQKQQQQQQQQPSFSHHHHLHHHSWVYFPLMDQLERGPLPISAVPPIKSPIHDRGGDDDDGAGDNRREFDKRVDGLLRAGTKMGGFGDGYGGNLKNLEKMKGYWEEEHEDGVDEEEEEEEEEDEDEECGDDFLMGELAAQMREFSEKFMRMERKKMDMIREIERYKMEMENKRMEMILVSQQKTVDLISKVFASSHKKMKTSRDLP